MENTSNTRNFIAHGGGEWVIGGKLTFLPGAVVEGGEGLFGDTSGDDAAQRQMIYVPDSEATTVAQLRESFNGLLSALRQANLMAPAVSEEQSSRDAEPGD